MHISDTALQCSRHSLRLAAECTDEHVAVELGLLAIRLMLAVIKDGELIIEEPAHLQTTVRCLTNSGAA
jgi:hypothetical protein